jgi:hypothetical protein
MKKQAGHQRLTSIILAIQRQRSGRSLLEASPGKKLCKPLSQKKPITKKGLVEWLNV